MLFPILSDPSHGLSCFSWAGIFGLAVEDIDIAWLPLETSRGHCAALGCSWRMSYRTAHQCLSMMPGLSSRAWWVPAVRLSPSLGSSFSTTQGGVQGHVLLSSPWPRPVAGRLLMSSRHETARVGDVHPPPVDRTPRLACQDALGFGGPGVTRIADHTPDRLRPLVSGRPEAVLW